MNPIQSTPLLLLTMVAVVSSTSIRDSALQYQFLASLGCVERSSSPSSAFLSMPHLDYRVSMLGLTRVVCVLALPPRLISQLTAVEVNLLPDATVALLSEMQLSALNDTSCAGVDVRLTGAAGGKCRALTAACVANIPPPAFKGISPGCLGNLSAEAFHSMTESQLRVVPDVVFGAITSVQVHALTPAQCAALSQGQIQNLLAQCSAITRPCFWAWSALQLSAVGSVCWAALPPDVIAGMGAARVRAISDECIPGATTPLQMAALQDECSAFTGEQGESFSPALCTVITQACGAAFSLPAAMNLNPECVLALHPATFGSFAPDALALLPADAFCRVNGKQLAALPPKACTALSKNQVMKITRPYCESFTAACVDAMLPERRSLLMKGCDYIDATTNRTGAPLVSAMCDHQNWDQIRKRNIAAADKGTEYSKKRTGQTPHLLATREGTHSHLLLGLPVVAMVTAIAMVATVRSRTYTQI